MADAFAHNLQQRGDDGASCVVYRDGKVLLKLWGGHRDRDAVVPWQEDTLVNVFSAAKPVLAWAVLRLAEQGHMKLDEPVATYWPEFGCKGKETISTRMLLSHRAGLPALQAPIADESIYDWEEMTRLLALEVPAWEPDTAQGYHAFTFGWLLGEVIARVSGQTFAGFVDEHLRRAHGIDLCFGVSDADLPRVAHLEPYLRPADKAKRAQRRAQRTRGSASVRPRPQWQDDLFFKTFNNPPTLAYGSNSPSWRQAAIPGGNGHGSGESLARFYGLLLAGELLSPPMLALCSEELSAETDQVLGIPGRFSHGFMLPQLGGMFNPSAAVTGFGHTGAGGSIAFADTCHEIGFAYVTRHVAQGMLADSRASKLIHALYNCLQ